MRRLAGALALVMLLGACAGTEDLSGERRIVGGVSVVFTVRPARIEVGQQARLAIRLHNNTGQTEVIDFPTGQQYDFWVTQEGEEVWRWSDDLGFTQATSSLEVPPQDAVTLAEFWVPEARGTFEAHGVVLNDAYGGSLSGRVTVGS
jgi:hypothetical protein